MPSARAASRHPLPPSLAPIGLDADEAAAYIGVGATKFLAMVADGRMPRPKRIDSRRVWYRPALDKAFAALPEDDGGAPSPLTPAEGDAWGDVRDNHVVGVH